MIHGLGTALITPFTATGEVDYKALDALLDIQLQGSVDFLVVLGTTAEAATMTDAEKTAVWDFVCRKVNGRLPLVLGLGGNNTQQVVETIHNLQSTIALRAYNDCSAILSVCPYYNKPSQEGLYQHFVAIAQASPVPIILYNVPGRTGVNLLPETVMRIYETCPDKIMGIKEASGNVEQIKKLIELSTSKLDGFSKLSNNRAPLGLRTLNSKLKVYCGDDNLAAELMAAGADGLISVASNAFPKDFATIVHQADHALQERYAEMVNLLFKEGNPSGIKTVLSQMGVIQNHLRLPLVPNSESVQNEIAQCIHSLLH